MMNAIYEFGTDAQKEKYLPRLGELPFLLFFSRIYGLLRLPTL